MNPRASNIVRSHWSISRLRMPAIALCLVSLLPRLSSAQANPSEPKSLTLDAAVSYALEHYPAVRASLEELRAAHAGVSLARAQYLPSLSGVYQDSRATQNQVPGIWMGTPITPTVEGPTGGSSGQSYWGSQAAALFSWEPFDFGLRGSMVGQAKSTEMKSAADVARTRLEVASAVANYYLMATAAGLGTKAAQANLNRWQVVNQSVHTLVDNQLRPGVDASRADAQLALAKTQLYQAQHMEQSSLATLAALMGIAGSELILSPGPLLNLPSSDSLPNLAAAENPVARQQMATVQQIQAQEKTLSKTDYPRLYLQGEGFARGSEVPANNSYIGNWNGLAPARGNWVAGITVLFPNVFDFKNLSVQKQVAKAHENSQRALYDKTVQDLTGQAQAALAALKSAKLVAEQTPVELTAARQSESQSRARYDASLTTIVEVADAEGLLARAEADDAIARMNVWRSLFGVAAAQGDLQPFLDMLKVPAHAGPQ
ncbi:MAG TPA: TolC family protein [Candidatus Sulfotelmatobacter sp.]|nr:TolC family protein [Candidatus Sulfotelmatobacter sp.]